MRAYAVVAALLGAVAVMLGAFGAHALRANLDAAALQTWHTAVEYQFWHALALLWVATQGRSLPHARWIASLYAAGVGLFCGSLYALALGAPRMAGAITPFGGMAFIFAWLLLAWNLVRRTDA